MKETIFSSAMFGKVPELQELLRGRIQDIDKKEDLGYSPLAIAVARGHVEATRVLLQNRADVNTQDDKGNTPLHYVGEHNYLAVAELLLEYGADVSIKNNSGNQPLWVAVFNVKGDHNKINLVRLLVISGADIYHKNKFEANPVDFAKKVNWPPLLEALEATV